MNAPKGADVSADGGAATAVLASRRATTSASARPARMAIAG